MHLALNHLIEDDRYLKFLMKCGNAGDWITLDNSAHEFTAGQPIEDLLVNAIRIKARELVIPDVLFHAMYTVEAGRAALKFLGESTLYRACSPTPRLMIVPQGRDEEDWVWCMRQLVDTAGAWGFRDLLTIGLSKDYESYNGFPGGLQHLIHTYLAPLYAEKGIKTHLLGWPCNWNIVHLARQYPCLRSTDTAKPFIYALRGIQLDAHHVPPPMRRPEDYFDTRLTTKQRTLASFNLLTFKLAARGVRSAHEDADLVGSA